MTAWPESNLKGMTEKQLPEHASQFPAGRSEILVRGPAGDLECLCDVPEAELALPATIVICHPHPQHGGTMHNKVVTIVERAMRELGLRTIRFNFRGVGASEGEFDDGYGESDDLFAITEWVRKTRPNDDLWLAGFSFGAYVSLRVAQNLKLGQLVSIAPAVNRYGFRDLDHPGCPWLIVQGDEDETVPFEEVLDWAGSIEPPPELVVMEQADHFFHRRLMDLRGLLKNGVRDQLPIPDTA
jgi:alpha/beta superfamily hydrolase